MSALDWQSPEPGAALPYGWTDADVATVYQMARELGISPLEILALMYSESGLNPNASAEGLGGMTSITETEMGWPHGTIVQLNHGPITAYLQALFQFWAHIAEKYVRGSYPSRAAQLGISPGAALYIYHGFLGPAMGATGPGTILGQRRPGSPVTWVSGKGWVQDGAPVQLSGKEALYAGNPGLDIGNKGTITIGDMQARVTNKSNQVKATEPVKRIYERLRSFDDLPTGNVPPLASLFGAVQTAWKALTGTNVRTTLDATEAPNTHGGATPETPSAGGSGAGESGAALLLVAGVVVAAYFAFFRKR